MEPTIKRRLGRTGVEVACVGLGGAPMGERRVRVADAEAEAIVEAAFGAGLTLFDTSPWYGQGKSELRMGRVLARKLRASFVLSTKVGRVFFRPSDPATFAPPWMGHGLPFDFRFDYTYDGVMRSYEDSLTRLGLNRVDLLLIHDLDRMWHPDPADIERHFRALGAGGGFRALSELKRAGEIKAIGAGLTFADPVPRLLAEFDLDFFLLAMPYSLLDQDVLDAIFPACAARGVGIVIGSVFASGILATGPVAGAVYNYAPAPPAVMEKTRRIQTVCARHAVALPAAALQFPLAHPLVTAIIPGAYRVSHVRDNLAHLRAPIPAAFWAELRAEGLIRADAPTPA
ncbi:MAG: aldo/keto reductase [Alphaproteobacteria bacterium]|nr:aldo/keto reductase [Alphaproteobacteria bacterium]